MFYTTKTELKEKTRMSQAICRMIAQELNVRPEQVNAAVTLIDDGNTVPFIARYRKEVTGALMIPSFVLWTAVCLTFVKWMIAVKPSSNQSKSKAN